MSELLNTVTTEELRRSVVADRKAGTVAWVDLRGLSVVPANSHAALLHSLAELGLGGNASRVVPQTVVLNWTNVDGTSAEAIALFSVLVRTVVAGGLRVIVCEPADGDIAAVLRLSGVREDLARECPDVRWLARESGPARRLEVLVPAVHFAGDLGKCAARSFMSAAEAALNRLIVDSEQATLISDAISEVVLNVLTHAEAQHATALMLLHRRRRPRIIEIGIADSGMGIASNILQQPRHAWLEPLSDRGAAAAVFGAALSGRDADAGGGGMTRIMRRLVSAADAVVSIRSGTANVTLRGSGKAGMTIVSHTYGWGTQTRIAVPVP